MGYIRHHAIIITSWSEAIKDVHATARKIFGIQCSEILMAPINGEKSFFIGPDGSKEGWDESDKGDQQRKQFIDYINSMADVEDKSNSIRFVELFYSEDNNKAEIINHN